MLLIQLKHCLNGKELHHRRDFEILDAEERDSKGSIGYVEWQQIFMTFDELLTTDEILFLVKSAVDVRENLLEKAIDSNEVKFHLENFHNKRKDSKAFKDAVSFLNNTYRSEKKVVDL